MRKVGCLGLLLGLVAIVAAVVVVRSWGGSGPAQRTVTVQVAEGSSLAAAARELERAGAIPSATASACSPACSGRMARSRRANIASRRTPARPIS
jgi:cell division protein YceG involved in septum cleavage